MGHAGISIDIEGLDEALEVLDRLSRADIKKIARYAGGELHRISMDAFEKETDPVTGEKWKDIKDRKGRRSGPILHDRGNLQDSVEDKTSGTSAIAGSILKYSRIHNKGGKAGRNRSVSIDRRRYVGHDPDFPRKILGHEPVRKLLTGKAA